jgi:hypothetical protein
MCECAELLKEIKEFDKKRKEAKEIQAIEDAKIREDFPKLKRTFTYRKSPAIKANDVCSL